MFLILFELYSLSVSMIRMPRSYTRTVTDFPYPTLLRSRATRHAGTQAGDVDRVGIGCLQDGAIQRRNAQEHRDAVPGYGLQRHLSVEAGKLFTYRSEEHTSELQSLMRISYAVFCLKKKKIKKNIRK